METTFLNQSESIEQISQALSSAYGELTNAHNDAQGAFSNNYASLGTVVANGNRQVLARYGLAILQGLNQVNQVTKEIEDRHPMEKKSDCHKRISTILAIGYENSAFQW